MRIRRRLLVFGLLAGLLVLAGGAWLLWPSGSATHENYSRLRYGMTLSHAYRILGASNDSVIPGDMWAGHPLPDDVPFHVWDGDGIRILLAFEDGTIRQGSKEFRDERTGELRWQMGLREQEGTIDMLRRWLRL